MFVLTAFQKNVNSATVDYHELGTLSSLLGLTHVALAHMWDFIWKIMMMSSSAISLWLGVYSNERHSELLLTGKFPGFIRVLSTGIKTVCELLLPVIGRVPTNNTYHSLRGVAEDHRFHCLRRLRGNFIFFLALCG